MEKMAESVVGKIKILVCGRVVAKPFDRILLHDLSISWWVLGVDSQGPSGHCDHWG